MERAVFGDPAGSCQGLWVTVLMNSGNEGRKKEPVAVLVSILASGVDASCPLPPFLISFPALRSMTKTGVHRPQSPGWIKQKPGLDFRPRRGRWAEPRQVHTHVWGWSAERLAGICASVYKTTLRYTNVEPRATELHTEAPRRGPST